MTRFLAVALLFSGALTAQDNKVEMILAAKVPNPKAKRPLLQCDGAVPLPDMAILFVSVGRSYETWVNGKLEPMLSGAGGLMAQVKERKFSLGNPIDGPGLFAVRVDLREELQNPKVLEHLKKTPVQPRSWNFLFSAWNEDLVQALVSNLQELDQLAADALEMVKRYELACAKEEVWKAQAKDLTAENGKLLKRCEQSSLKALYPAALTQIHYTVRNLQGNSPYFTFEAGKFVGATSYHADNQKLKTFREEDFTFENFKRYCLESVSVAGREFCLWILKDFRRAGNVLHPDASEAVTQMKTHAGVAEFVERLKALKAEELEQAEKEVRAAKVVPGAEKKDEKGKPMEKPQDKPKTPGK
ncbi:MAG TPA: hypothetical protein VF950_16800 [Planctomycetota bacterium]